MFTRTRDGAVELAEALTAAGVEAVDLHGNLSQRVRERNLHKFSSGKVQAVVATDVAARGIHVDDVDLVIHFDAANDPKAYLHRSGRTARAGKDGCVVTISTPKFVDQVVRLQRGAGVEVLHHDLRTAPRLLTAEALAETGPRPRRARRVAAARRVARSYSGGDRKPYRGQGGAPASSRGRPRRRPSPVHRRPALVRQQPLTDRPVPIGHVAGRPASHHRRAVRNSCFWS